MIQFMEPFNTWNVVWNVISWFIFIDNLDSHLSDWSPIIMRNVMHAPKQYTPRHKPHVRRPHLPHAASTTSSRVWASNSVAIDANISSADTMKNNITWKNKFNSNIQMIKTYYVFSVKVALNLKRKYKANHEIWNILKTKSFIGLELGWLRPLIKAKF